YTITRVVPAMALTGYATEDPHGPQPASRTNAHELEQQLITAGLAPRRAAYWSDIAPAAAERQLARLQPNLADHPATLAPAIEADLTQSAGRPDPSNTTVHEVTPAALNRVLFADDELHGLVEALARRIHRADDDHPTR